jgi:hypothetical protein
MAPKSRSHLLIPALALTAAVLTTCGEDVIIDVTTLPCGTARGNAASGNFNYTGLIMEEGCSGVITAFSTYRLLQVDETVVVDHSEPGLQGCPYGRLEILFPAAGNVPDFTLKGGIWSDGSFRIGNAVAVPGGQTFKVLFDGRFAPIEEGNPPQDHFSGMARVDIVDGSLECTYKVAFSGNRATH